MDMAGVVASRPWPPASVGRDDRLDTSKPAPPAARSGRPLHVVEVDAAGMEQPGDPAHADGRRLRAGPGA